MIRHRFNHGLYIRERDVPDAAGSLVYIHGLGESGLCFEGLLAAPRLERWRQLAPDMPGYGKCPWAPHPLGLAEHADHLARWMEWAVDGPAIVVGHSMGGVIGTLLAERHPHHVRAFLNVEGNISRDDCGFSGRVAGQPLAQFVATGIDRLLDDLYRQGLDDPAIRTYYPSVRLCDPRAYHRNSVELVQVSRSEELAARMARLNVPALFVAGLPRGIAERSRRILDEAGVAWCGVEDAGHWPFIDQDDTFIDEMVAFLSTL